MPVTVLIVDDSKLARIVAAKAVGALEPEWDRIEAANADEAVRLSAERKVDVALLDYNMAGRNGIELAEALHEMNPAMQIAIITANVQEEVIAAARAADASFVSKPLTQDGLRGFLAGAALRFRLES